MVPMGMQWLSSLITQLLALLTWQLSINSPQFSFYISILELPIEGFSIELKLSVTALKSFSTRHRDTISPLDLVGTQRTQHLLLLPLHDAGSGRKPWHSSCPSFPLYAAMSAGESGLFLIEKYP